MALSGSNLDREYRKFVESPTRPDQSAVEVVSASENLSSIIDSVSKNLTYIGYSVAGSLPSEAKWLIQKVSTSGTITTAQFANGVIAYNQIWDNRGSLTYA